MADLNQFTFTGRLTRQAELKSSKSGKYLCNLSIAIDNSYRKDGNKVDEVCFIECTAWSGLAELISKYTDKGHRVGISGSLKQQKWDDQEGKTHYKQYVLIEKFTFLQPKSNSNGSVAESFGGQSVDASDNPFSDPFMDDVAF